MHPRPLLVAAAAAAAAVTVATAATVSADPSAAPATVPAPLAAPAPTASVAEDDGVRTAAEQALQAIETRERLAEQAAAQAEAQAAAEAERRAAAEAAARTAQRAAVDPRTVAQQVMSETYGWGADQFACLDALWTRESNWDHTAQNPSSGAYGIPQSLPGHKMASHGADWQTNPVTQIRWGLDYISQVYRTPCSAWGHSQAHSWY